MNREMRNAVSISAQQPGFFSRLRQQRLLYLMLLPTLIAVAIFSYKPLMYWIVAFKDYRPGQNMFACDWVGLKYFKEFFQNGQDAVYVIRNTLVINLSSLVINLFSAMVFSIVLNEIRMKKLRKVVQTVSIFPFFVSWVITYSFCRVFFNVNSGLFNALLRQMGVIDKGLNILGSPKYGWQLIIGSNLWKSLGYNSVIFLSTIAGIDQEQYEAADIDGATRMQKILYITVPCLAGTLAVLLVMNSGWIFNSNFDQFYQFSNATNMDRTDVFDTYVYRFGLKNGRLSYATAVGVFKSFVSLIVLLITNAANKKMTGNSIY